MRGSRPLAPHLNGRGPFWLKGKYAFDAVLPDAVSTVHVLRYEPGASCCLFSLRCVLLCLYIYEDENCKRDPEFAFLLVVGSFLPPSGGVFQVFQVCFCLFVGFLVIAYRFQFIRDWPEPVVVVGRGMRACFIW